MGVGRRVLRVLVRKVDLMAAASVFDHALTDDAHGQDRDRRLMPVDVVRVQGAPLKADLGLWGWGGMHNSLEVM